jgi:hypothetical protein
VEVTPLTLQLLDWLDRRPRSYSETLEAWHTRCPRMTPWEDAIDGGLVRVGRSGVTLSPAGEAALASGTAGP